MIRNVSMYDMNRADHVRADRRERRGVHFVPMGGRLRLSQPSQNCFGSSCSEFIKRIMGLVTVRNVLSFSSCLLLYSI